jgi:plasmid stabilization system protein ParE
MGYKVIFAPQALARVEQVVTRIARDNPGAALRFGMRLVDHANVLTDFPELGRPYCKRPNVRRLLCRPYFIYYRLRHDERVVEILDYWHAAQLDPDF